MIRSPEQRAILEAAKAIRASENKARKAARPKRQPRLPAKPKATYGRERDKEYLAWLHDGLSCVACLILGPTGTRIEAAHQKIQSAAKGLNRKAGVRPDDWQTLPLCASHHTQGPICCDPAQAKFWSLLGFTPERVADFCAELHAAFRGGQPGEPIIQRYARENRP